tara:strand:- start:837 stop:1793 length:957 start_codon:yes stop_codon:yes gene_type:complete
MSVIKKCIKGSSPDSPKLEKFINDSLYKINRTFLSKWIKIDNHSLYTILYFDKSLTESIKKNMDISGWNFRTGIVPGIMSIYNSGLKSSFQFDYIRRQYCLTFNKMLTYDFSFIYTILMDYYRNKYSTIRINTYNNTHEIINHYHVDYRTTNNIANIGKKIKDQYLVYQTCRVILSGKTIDSTSIVKYIKECMMDDKFIQVFDNFRPDMMIDIESMIINQASDISPVILVIEDIDEYYNMVFDHKYTTGFVNSKGSFNNMLDRIEGTKNIITIFTTKKSISELRAVRIEKNNFHSFIRKGRINFFLTVGSDGFNEEDL